MQRHDWSSSSPKEPMSHPSLSPCTGYQLQLTSSLRHWCLHVEQPQVQHLPTSTHYYESTSPPGVWDLLVSDASWYHHRGSKSLSRTFSFTVPGWQNDLPIPIWNAGSLTIFKHSWKLIFFTWLHPKLKGKKSIYLYVFLPFELVRIWTMPETWYYEHFLCLFASLGRHVLCIAQL